MFKNKLNIIIAFLVGISLFSIFKYIKVYYEKKTILSNLVEKEGRILLLNILKENLDSQLKEKTRMLQEKEKIQQDLLKELNIKDEKIKEVEKTLSKAQLDIEQLQEKIDNLESQNLSLVKEKEMLLEKLDKLEQDRASLQARWNSLEELKKAIVQLKRKIYLERKQVSKTKNKSVEGNRGYIIKDGVSTLQQKIKIKVIPVN